MPRLSVRPRTLRRRRGTSSTCFTPPARSGVISSSLQRLPRLQAVATFSTQKSQNTDILSTAHSADPYPQNQTASSSRILRDNHLQSLNDIEAKRPRLGRFQVSWHGVPDDTVAESAPKPSRCRSRRRRGWSWAVDVTNVGQRLVISSCPSNLMSPLMRVTPCIPARNLHSLDVFANERTVCCKGMFELNVFITNIPTL